MSAGGPAPVRRVAVVGAGLAGLRTVGALRARGFDGHLSVVGAERHRPYDRPPLSKAMLSGADPTWLEADFGIDLDAGADDVRLGSRAISLLLGGPGAGSAGGPVVALESGDRVEADAVVLACGAQPVTPPGLAGALTLRTLEDAARLRELLRAGDRVVCVGAGWIGAEVAGSAAAAGCAVTVLELGDAPLRSSLGSQVGALTAPWYASSGIDLRTGEGVDRLVPGGVLLTSGALVAADVVVAGTGVRPAVDWLLGTGLRLGPGVRVDPRLRSSDPRVLAVGDCATRHSPRYGGELSGEHWDEALRAPDTAAATLTGQPAPPEDVPYVFSTQLGHSLALVGRPGHALPVVLRGNPTGPAGWSAAWVDGASMTAMFCVDRPRDLSQARRALNAAPGPGVPVDLAALADPQVPVRACLR